MTATPRRLLPTALKVAAVLSAIAIATFLILRAQPGADRTAPATDAPAQPAGFDGFGTSKSLVIDPSIERPLSPEALRGLDLLPSSKFGPVPSPTPPQQPNKQ